jgi:hypothetical protein
MNDGQWNYLMDMRDTGSWFARLPDSSIQLNGQGSVGGGDYPRKEWVHFVVIADSSSTTYYINGKQVGTKGGAAALNISTNLKIGCRVSRNEGFMGMMDDVAIWDRVLTADEIAQANKGPILKGGTAVDVTGKLSTTWANIKK